MILISTILWLAILTGMFAALAAFYGRYRVLPEILTGVLACETGIDSCNSLFQKKEAKLLGIPNAFLGTLMYVFLAIGLIVGCPTWLLICAASCGFAMSIYLGFHLIKNHRRCRICWIGHTSNAIIWFSLITKFISGYLL